MNNAEEPASKERRRLLIERLNEEEKLIGLQSPPRRGQMSEEELETEIERQRQEQYSRRGFGQMFWFQ